MQYIRFGVFHRLGGGSIDKEYVQIPVQSRFDLDTRKQG
jgi:hypothetical protein